jgi:hypothetical protein
VNGEDGKPESNGTGWPTCPHLASGLIGIGPRLAKQTYEDHGGSNYRNATNMLGDLTKLGFSPRLLRIIV